MPENDEIFTITLTPQSSTSLPAGLARNLMHEFTIPAHDNVVKFASGAPTTIAEGATATFSLDLSNPVPLPADLVSGNQFQNNQKFQINIASSTTDEANLSDISFVTPTGFEHLSFPPLVLVRGDGDTANPVSFMIRANEDADTRNETFTLTLSALDPPDGWSVPPETTHTFRITDNEVGARLPASGNNTIGFERTRLVVSEGGRADLTVVLKNSDGVPISTAIPRLQVNFNLDAGTLDPDRDLAFPTLGTNPVIFARAYANGLVTRDGFDINDDDTAEGEETFRINMTRHTNLPSGWEIESGAGVIEIVILPSDNTITFNPLAAASIAEGGSTTVTATIAEEIPAGETATIFVTPSDHYVLSTTGTDNGSVSGNIWTLPTGQPDAELTITAVDDTTINDDRALTIGFGAHSLPSGWSADDKVPGSANLTITDNDSTEDATMRTISFKDMGGMSISTLSITEPQTGYATITIDPVPTFDVTVPVAFDPAVESGTPSDPAPYTPGFAPFRFYSGEADANGRQITTFNLVGSTITIPGSESATAHNARANADMNDDIEPITAGSVTLQLTANEDLNTATETVTVTLSNTGLPPNYTSNSVLTVTITDDDTTGTITLDKADEAPPAAGKNLKEGDSSVLIAQATPGSTSLPAEGLGVIFEVTQGNADLRVIGLDLKDAGLPQFTFRPGGGTFGPSDDAVYSFKPGKQLGRILVTTRDNDDVGANQPVIVTMRAEDGRWPNGWTSPTSSYTFNVDDNDARVGFVGNLPTTTQEGGGASAKFILNPQFDDTKIPGPSNRYHIIEYGDPVPVRLPFEVGLARGQSGTFTATVTGTDDSNSAISAGDVANDVTINGETDNTYEFAITGNGTVQTENIDLVFKQDGVSEGAETFTVTVTPPSGLPSSVVQGTLTHTITVRESGSDRVSFISAETELVGVTTDQEVEVAVRLGAAAPSDGIMVTATVGEGSQYISLESPSIMIKDGAYTGNFVVKILAAATSLTSDATATLMLGTASGTQTKHTIFIDGDKDGNAKTP